MTNKFATQKTLKLDCILQMYSSVSTEKLYSTRLNFFVFCPSCLWIGRLGRFVLCPANFNFDATYSALVPCLRDSPILHLGLTSTQIQRARVCLSDARTHSLARRACIDSSNRLCPSNPTIEDARVPTFCR